MSVSPRPPIEAIFLAPIFDLPLSAGTFPVQLWLLSHLVFPSGKLNGWFLRMAIESLNSRREISGVSPLLPLAKLKRSFPVSVIENRTQ